MQETQETWVRSLGQEDPLEEEMITHSRILVLYNLKNRGAWQAKGYGVAESDMTERLHYFLFSYWESYKANV